MSEGDDGRELFKEPDDFFDAAFTGRASYADNIVAFAEAWKEAGDVLVDEATSRPRGQHDFFFPVIAYLYRQYIELSLKVIIRLASLVQGEETPEWITKGGKGHNLGDLLEEANRQLEAVSFQQLPPDVQGKILEMEEWDEGGTKFRYFVDTDEEIALDPNAVDLTEFKHAVDEIHHRVGGTISQLLVAWDERP